MQEQERAAKTFEEDLEHHISGYLVVYMDTCFEDQRSSIWKIKSDCILVMFFWYKLEVVEDIELEALLQFIETFVSIVRVNLTFVFCYWL